VTRDDFVTRYADTPALIIGTHFAAPTAGHRVRDGKSWRLSGGCTMSGRSELMRLQQVPPAALPNRSL